MLNHLLATLILSYVRRLVKPSYASGAIYFLYAATMPFCAANAEPVAPKRERGKIYRHPFNYLLQDSI
jgi:hypothetical protein